MTAVKRETRANVWFLVLFLGVSLPGAVMLFKKKLDPAAPAMYLPDPVKRRLPYITPLTVPDEVKRFVPELTGQWVAKLTADRAGEADVLMHDRAPLISEDRSIQLLAIKENPTTATLTILAWSPDYKAQPARYRATVECGGRQLPATVTAAESIDVPPPVRRELIYAGHAKPPDKVACLTLKLDAPTGGKRPLVVHLTYEDGAGARTSTLSLPPNPTS